jgi:hypothetical protein
MEFSPNVYYFITRMLKYNIYYICIHVEDVFCKMEYVSLYIGTVTYPLRFAI